METNEIIEYYNTLSDYAKNRVVTLVKDLYSAQEESRSYCIKVCPKCGAVEPTFTKGGFTHGGKQMLRCPVCKKRFVVDRGQLTFYSHQDEDKWDQLIEDTFERVSLKKTAEKLSISIYTAWRMRMKLLHVLEQLQNETVLSEEIELDEKYFLNSHKGKQIEGVVGRKRGGKAKKRGLSSEQICLPTVIQRDGNVYLQATNTATPSSSDIMKLAPYIDEYCMAWLDGKTAYNRLLDEKHCGKTVLKDHTKYTAIDHINNVNAFHRMIEEWYVWYRGVASKYINRYAALFVLVREYAGCTAQEILINIKRRLRQHSDYFRVADMMTVDLFDYSIS